MTGKRPGLSVRSGIAAFATRDRPVERHDARYPQDDETDGDPLSMMIGEIVREFQADGVLITHQHDGGQPVVLFANGSCEGITSNGDGVGRSPDVALSEWATMEGMPDSGVLTTFTPTRRGAIVVRTFFRRMGDTTRARARVASARLQPLLSPLARLWWQRRQQRSRERSLTAAINRTDVGVILVDGGGQPIFTNAAAGALLADGDGLRLNGAMLSGNALSDTLRLHAAIEHVTRAGESLAEPAPVLALPRSRRRPLMVAVMAAGQEDAPVPPGNDDGIADHAAILYVFDPEQDLCAVIEPACALYGLSPVETRLTCLLADGMCLAEAAEKLRVREMTARSYLKQIFLKTDTNRQAELVWLMLKSTVRTRPARGAGRLPTLV